MTKNSGVCIVKPGEPTIVRAVVHASGSGVGMYVPSRIFSIEEAKEFRRGLSRAIREATQTMTALQEAAQKGRDASS